MLKVARYRTWDELQELRTVWNPLLSRSASDTVFLTWEWLTAWWRNYGTGREIFVLAAFEGKELVGIAPLYVEDVRLYGSDWRRLRLIGDGSHDSDYLDCIAQRDRESETIASFFEFLEADHRSWNWIELNGSIQGSPCLAAAVQYARDKSWSFKTEQIRCAALPLHKTWDDYLRALQPRFRTKIRSSLALLNEYVKSTPDQCSSTAQIDDWLPALFDLHTRRWGTKSEPGVFLDSAKRAFYRDLSCAALEQGWLAFHRLSWCERPLAFQFGLLYKNRYHLLQEGYDPNFAAIRPGMALRAWLMRHWIETGIDEYDFLAGVSDYKLDWGAQEKSATRLLIAAQRKSALVALDMPRLQMQTRETLRHFTPAPLLSVRQKMMSRRGQQVRSANSKPSSPRSGIKGVARRLTSAIYSSTPVGKLGRLLATGYSWQPERNGGSFPLRRRSQPVCHILQYHRVNDDGDPFLGGLDVRAFRAQMEYLAANFPFLTLDQLASAEFPDRHEYYIAITFDDGYRDNFLCAFPTLKQLQIPATIFLATGYIESEQLPWYDQVRLAFKLTTQPQFSVEGLSGSGALLKDVSDRLRSQERTLGWLREMLEPERRAALRQIFDALGVASDLNLPNQMLRWEDIRQMAKHNISFGAHTVTHPVLSKISTFELEGEILGSKRTIENRLQSPVSHFAYPFGQPSDFNAPAKQSVRDAGFKTAVTTVWGLNQPNDDPFELKRFSPWETDLSEFKMKLDWYRFRMPQKIEDGKQTKPLTPRMATQEGRV